MHGFKCARPRGEGRRESRRLKSSTRRRGGGERGSAGKKARGEEGLRAVGFASNGAERAGCVGDAGAVRSNRTVGERGERLRDGAG